MPSKTTINWLFSDIWCYLFTACFDWKIGVFQQTVVKVSFILNMFFLDILAAILFLLHFIFNVYTCLISNINFILGWKSFSPRLKFTFNCFFFHPGRNSPYDQSLSLFKMQKQPFRGVLKETLFWKYAANLQENSHANVALQLYWNHTLAWVLSCKSAAYFQNTLS